MFLLWEGVILFPSFLEQVKNSVHPNSSLPSNWIQDENILFASNHIVSGKITSKQAFDGGQGPITVTLHSLPVALVIAHHNNGTQQS